MPAKNKWAGLGPRLGQTRLQCEALARPPTGVAIALVAWIDPELSCPRSAGAAQSRLSFVRHHRYARWTGMQILDCLSRISHCSRRLRVTCFYLVTRRPTEAANQCAGRRWSKSGPANSNSTFTQHHFPDRNDKPNRLRFSARASCLTFKRAVCPLGSVLVFHSSPAVTLSRTQCYICRPSQLPC